MLFIGQERSKENTALAAEPCCVSDSNCAKRSRGVAQFAQRERVSDSNNHPNGVAAAIYTLNQRLVLQAVTPLNRTERD
jgi:hypothetical protein